MSAQSPKVSLYRSIEALEGDVWPEPGESDTAMIRACHALRKKDLRFLTPNEIRLAFSQQVGADFLKEMAVSILEKHPAIDSNYFDGDLLLSVMNSNQFASDATFREKIVACSETIPDGVLDAQTAKEIQTLKAGKPNPGVR